MKASDFLDSEDSASDFLDNDQPTAASFLDDEPVTKEIKAPSSDTFQDRLKQGWLSKLIESVTKPLGNGIDRLADSSKAALPATGAAGVGAAELKLEQLNQQPLFDAAAPMGVPSIPLEFRSEAEQDFEANKRAQIQALQAGLKQTRQGLQEDAAALRPDVEGLNAFERGMANAPESILPNLATLPISIAIKNPIPSLAVAKTLSEGSAFTDSMDEGTDPAKAILNAKAQGAIEVITEAPGFNVLSKIGGSEWAKAAAEFAVKDIGGEQLATLGQDFSDWALNKKNENKKFGDYVAERPEAALETLGTSLLSSGVMAGAAKPFAKKAPKDDEKLDTDAVVNQLQEAGNLNVQAKTEDLPKASDFLDEQSDVPTGNTELVAEANVPAIDNADASLGIEPSKPVSVANTEPLAASDAGSIESPIVNADATINETLKPKKKAKASAGTLQGRIKEIGGISKADLTDITGETNSKNLKSYTDSFKAGSNQGLRSIIENGDVDEFLPPNMRLETNSMSDEAYDSTEAYEYLAERIANGERLLKYEIQQEILQNEYFKEQEATIEDAIENLNVNFTLEEINEKLRTEGAAETENRIDAQIFKSSSETSTTGRSEARQVEPAAEPKPKTIDTQENERVKSQVEIIIKRKAAANQINRGSQYEKALGYAKQLMNGEAISPAKFKNAANELKSDETLSAAFTALNEMAKNLAKSSRAEKADLVSEYKEKIGSSSTADELQKLAKEIQYNEALTDKQAQDLDDLVFDKQDKLEANKVELIGENGGKITSPLYVGLANNDYKMLKRDDAKTYKDKEGTAHTTFEKDGVRIALDGSQVLFRTGGKGRPNIGQGEIDDVILSFIGVDEDSRNKGKAKQALELIASIADKEKLNVYLEPAQLDKSGLTDDQLIKLYGKYGFVAKGEDSKVMLRKPNAATESSNPASTPTKNADLLGDDTAAQQAIKDAEAAKDNKRNSGDGNTEGFTLTGSNSEADKAAANGAQDLFAQPAANAKKPAPITEGVDKSELDKIVDEFKEFQEEMLEDDFQVHHLFDPPKKKDIVRLQHKVKADVAKNGYMTVDAAQKRIGEWKKVAVDQGKNPVKNGNANKVVLSLFDYTGKWAMPWAEAGYDVYTFDIQDDVEMGDVNKFDVNFFADYFGDFDGRDIHAILAACPCTDFAVSGARHFAAKDKDGRTLESVELVHQTLNTIEYFKPSVWAIENPVGRIERLGSLPPWRLSFDPNHLGDPYTKKTLLWGRFNADLPIAPVEPTEGSKMHTKYGGKSQATKNARSATPEGFAYGFFMANNAVDHLAMTISNKYDRLDADLIKEAVDNGITEEDISDVVDDPYYQDLDDDAANEAIRDLINDAENDASFSAGEDQTKTEAFIKWAGTTDPILEGNDIHDEKFVEEKPYVMRLFHGTTHSFDRFDASKVGNTEGQFGAVNYFTSSEYDAETNYTSQGQDLTNRIQMRIEELESEAEYNAEEYEEKYGDKQPKEIAEAELKGFDEKVMELYVRTDKPFVVGTDNSPWLTLMDETTVEDEAVESIANSYGITVEEVQENRDQYEDEIQEERYALLENEGNPLIEAIQTVADRYDVDASTIFEGLYEVTADGEVNHDALEDALRTNEGFMYAESNEDGRLIGFQMVADVIQELGFDSIILKNANKRFERMDMESETTHVHIFNENNTRIKSATDNAGTFDPNNENINLSAKKSNKGMTAAQVKEAIKNDTFNHDVDVYDTFADMPDYIIKQASKEKTFDVEGFFDKVTNRVAMVAENIPNATRAKQVATHELVGHYGLENMIGKQLTEKLVKIVQKAEQDGNKTIIRYGKKAMDRQPNISERRKAKEIIAIMAEEGVQNSIVRRVYDAIRKWLKKKGFIKTDITDAHIASLLRDVQAYLAKKGRSYVEPSEAEFSVQNRSDKSPYRGWITNIRGDWTKDKIRKELRSTKNNGGKSGRIVHREIAKFDSAKEFSENIFYHGTGSYVNGGLYPSIVLTEAQAEREGGGGYGERYWAISLSKSKNSASNFTGASSYGSISPVILKKDANVIDMPEIKDSAELEDIIEQLWTDGVDAVKLGDWTSEFSEQELAVLNPNAIFTYTKSQSFPVFKKEKFENLTDAEVNKIYDASVEAVPKLDNARRSGLPKDEKQKLIDDAIGDGFLFSTPPKKPKTVDTRDNWLFRRDDLGRVQLNATGKMYDVVSEVTQKLADKVQMGQATPELRKAIRHYKADMQKALDQAAKVAKVMTPLDAGDRALVSDVVEKMVATGVVPPDHILRIAAGMQQAMDKQTDELVSLGMLSQDSADRWRGKYLPRFYNRAGDPALDTLSKKVFTSSLPVRGMGGGSLKGRGLFQEIDVAELDRWEELGWEVRDTLWKKNQQGKLQLSDSKRVQDAEKVMIWRDFTAAERQDMGENRDALFRYVMGYTSMQNDIALGRLFDTIAKNQEWTRARPSEGYVQVSDAAIPETGGVKRYGNLAGLYVRADIASHLSQYDESGDLMKFYKKALGIWKMGKTALNPVAHANNMVSNLTMAHFAGVSYWETHKYIAAVRDFITDNPMVQEARDVGLMTGDITRAELVKLMPKDIQALVNQQDSKVTSSAKATYNLLTFGLIRPMSAAYSFEDDFFKYLIYRDARAAGVSPDDAVDYATRYIFTYDDLPRGARAVRDSLIPFFSYTYKAVPALANTAFNYPWRFAAPALVIAGINALSYALVAGDDEDDWLTKYEKGKALEAEERENLPPWMKGRSALGTQKTIRLGTDEVTGLPVFWDMSRFIPGGDVFDINNQAGGVPFFAPLTPSNPVLTTMAAMFWNKDTFLGKEIVDINDTSIEAAKKRSTWLLKQISPAIAPTGYHFERLMQAAAYESDTTIETPFIDYTGISNSGTPSQAKYAIPNTIGMKIRPIDLELSADINEGVDRKELGTIRSEGRALARQFDKGAISERYYDAEMQKLKDKVEVIRNKQ